ncbi:SLC13 family permease [Henriciella sp. AS95]|uniref:SLC13 family permease n=1 Tax=Henriciella sp. AS95 TaxID=3135782 RepID=UPI003178B77D
MIDFLNANATWIALFLLAAMFVSFVAERINPAATAIAGAAAFLALGYVTEDLALGAFANSAPIAIGAFFILAAALQRTGVLEYIAGRILAVADKTKLGALALVGLVTIVASAFVSNTAVVVILVPVIIALSQKLSVSRKRLLIPLSFVSILGGTMTLIGTSSNLLVAGVAQSRGLERFGIFEISAVGIFTLVVCLSFLIVFGRWLLPSADEGGEDTERQRFFLTDIFPNEDSKVIGLPPEDVPALKAKGVKLVSHRRGNRLIAPDDEDRLLSANDRLTVRVTLEELLTLSTGQTFKVGLRVRKDIPDEPVQAQATIAATDPNIGRPLSQLSHMSNYQITVRGLSRSGHQPGPTLSACRLHAGDTLLLEGTAGTLRALGTSTPLLIDHDIDAVPFRRGHAPIAICALAGVIIASAVFGVPLAVAALIGVGAVMVTGCISTDDAWRSLQAGVLALIVAMLIVGRGMEETGALALIVDAISPVLLAASPFVVLLIIYAMTSLLTELITNAAVAVIMTPLVITLAGSLGMDPRALVLAVMFGASASFASPIGYQTNTIVYSAGNYRFSDFIKIGLPMNIMAGLASCTAIWLFFLN